MKKSLKKDGKGGVEVEELKMLMSLVFVLLVGCEEHLPVKAHKLL